MFIIAILIGVIWLAGKIFGGGGIIVALAAVVGFVLVCLIENDRRNAEAWYNWRDYWAEGGPDRRGRRRR